jgi:hypothetical protein
MLSTDSLRRSRTRENGTLDSISLLRRCWRSLIKNAHIHEPDSVDRTASTLSLGLSGADAVLRVRNNHCRGHASGQTMRRSHCGPTTMVSVFQVAVCLSPRRQVFEMQCCRSPCCSLTPSDISFQKRLRPTTKHQFSFPPRVRCPSEHLPGLWRDLRSAFSAAEQSPDKVRIS